MNKMELDILASLIGSGSESQRTLSERSGYSLGAVNKTLRSLADQGFVGMDGEPSEKALEREKEYAPKRAVILAAGSGLRMVPLHKSTPKALLKVQGEVMIERTIRQLWEVGIREIAVVIGFMQEAFEYLIDDFGVELIVNNDFSDTNNIISLYLARNYLKNVYIIPSDIYCVENPFRNRELYSWYMMDDRETPDMDHRVNRKSEIVRAEETGNREIGIAYLAGEEADTVRERLEELAVRNRCRQLFWENTLERQGGSWIIYAREVDGRQYVEVNSFEQYRSLDQGTNSLRDEAYRTIEKVLGAGKEEIHDIRIIKKGMMNRSFRFEWKGKWYIIRVPDPESNRLVNRSAEAEVYGLLKGRGLSDNCLFIDPENGYKLTDFIPNARSMDPYSESDIRKCMSRVHELHDAGLKVSHHWDFYQVLEHYEALWGGEPSIYPDYERTKEKIYRLKPFIERYRGEETLCHVDVNPDNFLIYTDQDGEEKVCLIDWEFAAMQDPDVDVANCILYVMYDREHADRFIDLSCRGEVTPLRRAKIYAYMSVCGLIWSNWCECKNRLGIELGEYSLRQYRYAKDYYRLTTELLDEMGIR